MTKSQLMASTTAARTRIYRAKLHTQELIDNNFDPTDDNEGWDCIKRILLAKGLPTWCTEDRTPVNITAVEGGIWLEFTG